MLQTESLPSHNCSLGREHSGEKVGRILLLRPDSRAQGGVASYYNKLRFYYKDCRHIVRPFRVGRSYDESEGLRIYDYLMNLKKYVSIMLSFRPDIIHANPSLDFRSLSRDTIYILVAKILNVRIQYIVHIRGWREEVANRIFKKAGLYSIFSQVIRRAKAIIVLAHKFRRYLEDNGISNVIVMYTVSEDTLIDTGDGERSPSSKKLRILYLSRIDKRKGVFELAEAILLLDRKYIRERLSLCIAGDGPAREALHDVFLENEIYVEMPGYIVGEDKARAYQNADVFVLPSWHEGCPNSLIEAMAHGLIIIATGVGAIPELVEDGAGAMLVPKRSPEAIAEAILEVDKNRNTMHLSAQKSAERIRELTNPRKVMNDLVNLYDGLINPADKRPDRVARSN